MLALRLPSVRFVFACGASSLALVPMTAWGQATSGAPVAPHNAAAPDAAREAFEGGLRLMDDARFAEATALFERSLAARPTGAAQFNLGLALRGMGAYRRAIAALGQYLAMPADATDVALRAQAETIRTELGAALVRVTVHVHGSATSATVDEQPLALSADGDAHVQLDPGHHTFDTAREGYRPAHAERDFAPSQQAEVTLEASANPIPPMLMVDADVSGTVILLDGRVVGQTHWEGEATVGPHRITLRRNQDLVASRSVTLQPGATQRVTLSVHVEDPIYGRWYFWAGIGVVVAAVAGAIVYDANNFAEYQTGSLHVAIPAIMQRR